MDGAALIFALLTAGVSGLLFGITPALQFSHHRVHLDLKDASRGLSTGRQGLWIREALVISEVALASVLLVGAGLLIHSFIRLTAVDLGFQPEHVAVCRFLPDKNLVENDVRVPVVGRKRWLFIGHPDAGWYSAVIYTVIQSCRRRGINPLDYLTDVLSRLPAMKSNEVKYLLPGRWKPQPK